MTMAVDVFAVEDDAAQVIVRAPGGPPVARAVTGLHPDATQTVDVLGQATSITTLRPPPGRLLSRVATLSDLHLGLPHHFGVRDHERHTTPFPLRCARAAVREALAWGADALVFKGDLTQHARPAEFEQLAELLDEIEVPVGILLGNHDARLVSDDVDARKSLANMGRPFEDVAWLDVPGARIILVDTTVPGRGYGRVHHVREHAIAAAADATDPVVLMLHHHLEPHRIPIAYPFGVPARPANAFLDELRDAAPALFVTSGHSHRNRARIQHGVPITQVGSVKDYPGVWAGYAIHEGGIRQVVRRVAEPTCIEWTERTAAAMAGIWGRWTPGRLGGRCLTHVWPSQTSRSS
jgi:3',5'-cyclic AMP phosphodiesterase CpdA